MRASAIVTAVLLSFGVWGGVSAWGDQAKAAMPEGDAARGADVYEGSCGGCHSLDANRIGPAHRGVVGRAAGKAADFDYSPALKRSKVIWTPKALDRWLTDPQGFIKGSRMGFRLADAQKRADVIAYLAAVGSGKGTGE